jgi:acetoin utilization protein AcuB
MRANLAFHRKGRVKLAPGEREPAQHRAQQDSGMSCASIMTLNPRSVREDDTIGEAAREIIACNYINLPVVDAERRLVGLFGIYDLLALLVPRVAVIGNLLPNLRFLSDDETELCRKFLNLKDSPVRRAVNREAVRVYPDTPLVEGIRLFCRNHMTIPVVEHGTERLVGMISYWDAARHIIGAPATGPCP